MLLFPKGPKGALTHHFVVAKSASLRFRLWRKLRALPCSSSPHKAGFAGPREAVVTLPLVGLVRSAEGYPLLTGSTGYAAIHPPSFGGYTCRKNTGKFSGRILQTETAACEKLPLAPFLQKNMETAMFLHIPAICTGRR